MDRKYFIRILISQVYTFVKTHLIGPGVVVHTYNPSYSGGRDKKTEVQDQSGQKN
jgi:hypothetical protein